MAKIEYQDFGNELKERNEEIGQLLMTYDPAKDLFLTPRWDGVYKFRILPLPHIRDWLVPYGTHWNVIPSEDGAVPTWFGCPRHNFGKDCPVCDAIDASVANRESQYKDWTGEGGIACQRRALVRVLLISFSPDSSEEKAPKFEGLPLVRIMALPASGVGKRLIALSEDDDFGFRALTHPTEGRIIKATRSKKIMGYWDLQILDSFPIPEEFLETDDWPKLEDFLPNHTTAMIEDIIKKNSLDVDQRIVNYVLGRDVQFKALPSGRDPEDVPRATRMESKKTKDLKDRLKRV